MMRNAATAVFFLAMAPLGLMAAEVDPTGQRATNAQDTTFAEGKAQHLNLRQGGARAGGRGRRGLLTDDMETLLELHNQARCLHNASPLAYSDAVATSAMAHAQVLTSDCGELYHSDIENRNGYGENLHMCASTGTETCFKPEDAMDDLYEGEVQTDSVAEYGLHATQILWKSTTDLGCAVATCTEDSFNYVYLVCQYSPAGNNMANLEEEVDLPTGASC